MNKYVIEKAEDVPPQVRAFADGIKLALHELALEEPETLRNFIMASFSHLSDGANKWVGAKLIALLAGTLVGLGLWLISKVEWR